MTSIGNYELDPSIATAHTSALHKEDHVYERGTTRFHDFCFDEYAPRCDPRGRLHSVTLLRHFLRQEGFLNEVWPLIARFWAHLGRDEVIWAAKWTTTGFHSFELYVYNYDVTVDRECRTHSGLSTALAPYLDTVWRPRSRAQYELRTILTSYDIDAAFKTTQRVSGGHVYTIADPYRSHHRDQLSYGLHPDGLRFENHYRIRFGHEIDEFLQRLRLSVHASGLHAASKVLPAELRDCYRLIYGTKSASEGVYFGRVSTAQLTWFAEQFLPAYVGRTLRADGYLFAHLEWDLGMDFVASDDETGVALRKFAIHGFL
jgi:hypothetical protein